MLLNTNSRGNTDWTATVRALLEAYGDTPAQFADRAQRMGRFGNGASAAQESDVIAIMEGRFTPTRRWEGALQQLADEAPDKSAMRSLTLTLNEQEVTRLVYYARTGVEQYPMAPEKHAEIEALLQRLEVAVQH